MSDVIKLAPPAAQDDGFDEIYDRMHDEIDSLRCVLSVLRSRTDVHDDELLAALNLLGRATKRIDELHTAFEEWHLCRRRRPSEPQEG